MSSIKQGYKQTKVGIIPEDWDVVNFDELKDKTDKHSITGGPFGSDLKSEHYTTSGVRVIQLQNIGDGKFINKEFVYTSEEKANQLKNCLIYPNEIILAKMAEPVARACLIPLFEDKFLMCSDGIRLLVDKNRFSTKYVLEYINYDLFRKIAIDRSTGSTRGRIGLSDLKTIPLALPPLKEQEKIAEILTTWDEAISLHVKLIEEKEQLKIGLMQKLLSGEVRFDGFSDEWETFEFEEIFERVPSKKYQINSNEYQEFGKYPVVDQGKKSIIAYSNNEEKVYENSSIIVFGDHTRELKYIDFDFVVGADGTQLIKTKDRFDNKFFYYYLLTKSIPNTGYNRHFKFLLEMNFDTPSLPEQQKIAKVLSLADDELKLLKKELEVLKQQKKGLMQKLLTGEMRAKV